MKNCWAEHAQDRPSFSDLITVFETLMSRDNPYVELVNTMEMGDNAYVISMDDSDQESDISETKV